MTENNLDEKVRSITETLIKKTKEDKIRWREVPSELKTKRAGDMYIADLEIGNKLGVEIGIQKDKYGHNEELALIKRASATSGRKVLEEFKNSKTGELFRVVRRQNERIEEKVDELVSYLEGL